MSVASNRLSNGRQQELLRFIEQQGQVSVAEISEQFSVSLATARRYLDALAERGNIERYHGGASITRQAPPELPVHQRTQEQAAEKQAIGRAAAALVNDGETVFLGSGTTVYQVALHLRDRRDLTVITNSLPVLNFLSSVDDITLICLGGIFRASEMSLIGHLTEHAVGELRADKVIIGIRGIDLKHGLTAAYLPETMTDRAVLRMGREVILVADSTKCGRVSTAFVAPLTQVHTFVTDLGTPQEFVSALTERGIRVVQA